MDGQKPTLNDVAMYFDDAGIRSTKEDSYAATVRAAMEAMEYAAVLLVQSGHAELGGHAAKMRKMIGEST